MISVLILFVLTAFLLKKFLLNPKKDPCPKGLKPIPVVSGGLPIIGHLHKITRAPFQYLNNLKEEYGPLFSIQIGWKTFIVLCNYEVFNKSLKEQGNNFSGRWENIFTTDIAHDSGILFKDKEWWAAQRSFTLRVLRDFGFGKQAAEHVVHREVEKLTKNIQLRNGRDIETSQIVAISTVNIISDFIMKTEFQEDDETIILLIKSIKKISQAADVNSLVMNIFPIFEWFPKLSKVLLTTFDPSKMIPLVDFTTDFIGKIVEEHRKRFNPENECQDLIDAFLMEQYKLKNAKVENHSFTDWQLIRLISELFLAGYETTSTSLSWTFLILAKYPEIQNKLRDEITKEIGLIRLPTMADKKSLNYCQAFMDELYRFSTVLPLSIAHRVFENASINGYFVPANSILFPNIYACHRDPSVWTKPYEFYPMHFLDESGNYQPKPELIPFGLGKRQCLGEGLARMEIFLVLVSILQRFHIYMDQKYMNMEASELLKGSNGTFRGTIDHKLHFQEI